MFGPLSKVFLAAACLLLASGSRSDAGLITTTFASNNLLGAPAANLFDIAVGGSSLRVDSLQVNVLGTAGQAFGVAVYEKSGTYVGSETNSSAWTLESTGTGICAATANSPESVTLNSTFVMNAGTTYGWLVEITTANAGLVLNYTTGTGANQSYSNADLALTAGASESSYFGQIFSPNSKVFQNRVWNGSIEYTVVPEPASLSLLVVGLAAVVGCGAARAVEKGRGKGDILGRGKGDILEWR
jgi:hypothetical protein